MSIKRVIRKVIGRGLTFFGIDKKKVAAAEQNLFRQFLRLGTSLKIFWFDSLLRPFGALKEKQNALTFYADALRKDLISSAKFDRLIARHFAKNKRVKRAEMI